jgi:hypothetical protein
VTFAPGETVVATVNLDATSVQPAPVTEYVTAPVPEPPVVASVIPVVPLAIVAVFALLIESDACVAALKVRLTAADIAAA